LTDITIQYDESSGFETQIACTVLDGKNPDFNPTPINYYYDLAQDTNLATETAIASIESSLLNKIATRYRILPSGASCESMPFDLDLWMWKVSSGMKDEANYAFDRDARCLRLSPSASTQSCTTVYGQLLVTLAASKDTSTLKSFIKNQFNTNALTEGTNSTTLYLASEMDLETVGKGRDELTGVNSIVDVLEQPKKDDMITPEGVFFAIGLLCAAVLLAFVMIRRRRRTNAKSADITDYLDESVDGSTGANSIPRYAVEEEDEEDMFPASPVDYDIGGEMKNEALTVYGRDVVTATSLLGDLDESDGEDSWAQTEGTIGSIELHLEPITAEV